jgi:endoglucanase
MKKYLSFIGSLIALITTSNFAQMSYDYGSALDAAVKFYDAQRCGPDAGTGNLFSWRGACHTGDKDGSVDLTGGYHDAGDFPKFGLPQCWSAATLEWAMYEYPSVFSSRKDAYFRMLKWFTDYFLKCHSSTGTFYYHVGDGNADHGYWGSPEAQPASIPRTPLKAPPGSDVCGEAAAALALMYLNYKSIDAAYAQKCLDAAKDIYAIALASSGSKTTARCSDNGGGNFYKSSSHYDDMAWGAIWLYTATGTASYLDSVDHWTTIPNDPGDNQYQKRWSPAWDDVILFVLLKMAEITGDDKYYQGVVWNLDWCVNQANKSPAGLPIIDSWGPLRYASAEAGLGFLSYKLLGYKGFNVKGSFIIDYCLGTNPDGRSYLTGWGKNPPIHPSHRANEPVKGGAVKGLIGGLVGGPTNDAYEDNVEKYQISEVALDYNASFILGVAGQMYVKSGGLPKNRAPSVTIASPLNGVAIPAGAKVNIKVVASDPDGKVTKIDLYKGDQLLGSSTTSPYIYAWENAPLGDATFKANATDDSGKVSNFATAIIHVTGPCTPGQMQSRTGWVATASNHSPNAPEAPGSALDGDFATRWSSGGAMASGMWFQIDMGFPRDFSQIVFDATGSGSDFPLQYKVYATNDTGDLGTPIATGAGAQVTYVTLPTPASGQYIRIVCVEGQGGSWWSIHEINVRCPGATGVRFAAAGTGKPLFGMDAIALSKSVLVNYSVPEPGRVTIEEFSPNGSRLGVLFDGFREAGNYSVTCKTDQCGAKMAFFKINYKGFLQVQRAVLLK